MRNSATAEMIAPFFASVPVKGYGVRKADSVPAEKTLAARGR